MLTPCGACRERETAPPLLNIATDIALRRFSSPFSYNKRSRLQCTSTAGFIVVSSLTPARASRPLVNNDIHGVQFVAPVTVIFKQDGVVIMLVALA